MASISSTNGTSSSSSLGNTSLRGFGGMVSGLDRDGLIEAMTTGTQTKITKAQQTTTKLEWKQEAYQEITDKVLDLEDTFFSMTSGKSIKNADIFSSNVVTTHGAEDSTKYVTVSGSSDMTSFIKLKGVSSLATSAAVLSSAKGDGTSAITTNLSIENPAHVNKFKGISLEFSTKNADGSYSDKITVGLPEKYKNAQGETVEINYDAKTPEDIQKLVDDLNGAKLKAGENQVTFSYENEKLSIHMENNADEDIYLSISGSSEKLSAWFGDGQGLDTYRASLADVNNNQETGAFKNSLQAPINTFDYLADNQLSITFGGSSKTMALLTNEQAAAVSQIYGDGQDPDKNVQAQQAMVDYIQTNLDKQFGKGKIDVSGFSKDPLGNDTTNITGITLSVNQSQIEDGNAPVLSINSGNESVRENLGIVENQSSRISVSSKLKDVWEKLTGEAYDEDSANSQLANFKINGETIEKSAGKPLTADMTVSELLSAINNSSAGVRASYMSSTGQFSLVAANTGTGRMIDLGADGAGSDMAGGANVNLSMKIFGFDSSKGDDASVHAMDGKDAVLYYDNGSGVAQKLTSSSNSFELEGLTINVSGTFGIKDVDDLGNPVTYGTTGQYRFDTSKSVSLTSAANVDKATENVKAFVEAFNDIVKLVNTQNTTRPNSSYKPLTDAQKDEMSEKSIENWEKKAKEGILYGDSAVTSFADTLRNVMSNIMADVRKAGYNYEDLKSIGISMSDDIYDGGTIAFDEDTFKKAMETNPDKVGKIFNGTGDSSGLAQVVEDSLTPYATRYSYKNGGSYGRLVKEAGSSKLVLSKTDNYIYKMLQQNQTEITKLRTLLKKQQDRAISQFSSIEKLINNMNAQSSYITSMQG